MELNRKNVLIIIPSLRGGGAERVLLNFLEKADLNKFKLTLVVVLYSGVYRSAIPKGVEVVPLFGNPWLERLFSYIHKRYRIGIPYWIKMKLKIRGSFDVGISYQDSKYTDLLFFVKKIEKRICWVHSSQDTNPNYQKYLRNDKYKERLLEKRYSRIDEIVFVSQSARDGFFKMYNTTANYRVVNNVLNSSGILKKAMEPANMDQGLFTFMALGSLLPVKDYARLIRSSKILVEKGYNFRVLIIGEGPERRNLTRLAADLKLEEQIELAGYVENPYPILKNSDVFVTTSISEAMPTSLCEAFILGIPIITTRCAAFEEYTEDGRYALMAEQDDHSLAEKMELLLTNEELRQKFMRLSSDRGIMFNDEIVIKDYYTVLTGS